MNIHDLDATGKTNSENFIRICRQYRENGDISSTSEISSMDDITENLAANSQATCEAATDEEMQSLLDETWEWVA
jgi:hypothetical protein